MSYLYIVTEYGCNSCAHSMWPPKSSAFTDFDAAYAYFLQVSPRLDDTENRAEQKMNPQVFKQREKQEEHIIIEIRAHIPGYLDGDGTCSKRPQGAVFAATLLRS